MQNEAIRILLADSQPLTVAGLIGMLSGQENVYLVDVVHERFNLFDLIEKHRPGVLIVDYNIPGYVTIDDLKTVETNYKELNVLVISSDNNKANILKVLQTGVKGYLTKECSREEVMLAIQATSKGEKFFCHKILDVLMEKSFAVEQPVADQSILTSREREILGLIASGRSNNQIADDLYLSPHTVHSHRKSIIRKLNIKSPTEFVIHAIDFGLIKPR